LLHCRNCQEQSRVWAHLANKVLHEGTIILLVLKDIQQNNELGVDRAVLFRRICRLAVALS
jgi:hypothetical protein